MTPRTSPGRQPELSNSESPVPTNITDDPAVEGNDVEQAGEGDSQTPNKKRKRIRRSSDQKHVCDAPKCGKSYTRLEHLHRHQLNRESAYRKENFCLASVDMSKIIQITFIDVDIPNAIRSSSGRISRIDTRRGTLQSQGI